MNKLLVDALRAAGHDVLTVIQANLISRPDDVVFAHAIEENRIVITSNCDDFLKISDRRIATKKHHPGILLVFLYNNPNKDMSVLEIVKAIANLEATEAPIVDACVSLAHYRY